MPYVYMLECADGSLYTGITTDLKRRMRQHAGQLAGGAKYTRSHPPRRLLCVWETAVYQEAARFEASVKGLSREQKQQLAAAPHCWPAFLPKQKDGDFVPLSPEKWGDFLENGEYFSNKT